MIDLDEAERIGKAAIDAPWFHDKERTWSNGGIYTELYGDNKAGVPGTEKKAGSGESKSE